MSDVFSVSNELRSLWARFKDADTTRALHVWGWELVKKINLDLSAPVEFVDLVLAKCSARPIVLSGQGFSIVMLATPEAREAFRARLVECGMFLEAMRLAEMMKRPLSRDEVVALGRQHLESLDSLEVEQFLVCALRTDGMQELDLRRISKQFGVEVEHIVL
ncbi:MAG: hypothetical protein A3C93_05820 [Candidatus Lloydbacteria bacterium RIFCSPHIGHO2_02_FULL_54_17]|uniref:Uncharacterized protein n=1 Tax=Candidatus Lloydbacteria bacterium RIFCSPHIGHO2_02_FULL_54_17 TaxID=1798664 RepID=A0A1G2DGE0_9BACT|nr:MAG: hypothetical protein A2762_02765 [Candidatus Lloydbacteria bacterium RIFCSPHIGHO2_01_FULL_54_11]OGZ11930.1 MAG: hypothetical protein A3C93_05820 [Candidatus Lloydbacteria bacterium RIFCSPHIGHO2_02_FULL_54_17]OGZ14185.1 MAG: hypothetical protein A2948_02510 [Candidatus Lloydbacteria bacterium RIFCSPLOWO2_01_FULL_54_18]OGZ15075.1 MAG: hypothetical protein A3H76_06640 [Candidatus Lloydbacteria bacterium RIFCSPLOWO2_02_FULL_54_12]